MATQMVSCVICKTVLAEALSQKVKGPGSEPVNMCKPCHDRLGPKLQQQLALGQTTSQKIGRNKSRKRRRGH